MEEWQSWWADNWPIWYETLAAVDPVYYAIGVGILLLLWLVRRITRRREKAVDPATLPRLSVQSFQIAPLGRDAFLKIRNDGPPAQLSVVNIPGRTDVKIKNIPAGQIIATGKEYSLLLETVGNTRMTDDLNIEFVFTGPDGRAYQQVFNPNLAVTAPARRY